ncbi:hypothetical protein AB0C65_32895 [Nocardia sp. NPDC048505]|uniref:hypothetical protein n=1 Tax=Nocardia sp. NPDC048505 TaxID=3155756 RepID=UPI0033FEEC49
MTGFVLSPDRRDQLSELLSDEERLKTQYPTVADYFSMVPNLPGTGDADADRAFDIRFLHFMTGGESDNPYWEIVAPLVNAGPADRHGRREINGGRAKGSARLAYAQMALQSAYAYAVPSSETIDWIAASCAGRGVVELGAGRGYWAHQLARRGVDVLAFDVEPPNTTRNVSFPNSAGQRSVWHPVGKLDDFTQIHRTGEVADRVLLLCWPPGWGSPMADDAVAALRDAGGDSLIYVGEPQGGKTANDDFFRRLSNEWRLVEEDPGFVSWWNLNDCAQFWTLR